MKNKLTSVLMGFIIILIIAAATLIGGIIIQELKEDANIAEIKEISTVAEIDENTFDDVESPENQEITETTNQSTEVPQTANNLNKLRISEKTKEEQVEPEKVNFDNVNVNKYFYKQLNQYSQIIYKGFEKNKENMKTGTSSIEFGDSFTNILSKANGQDELGGYYQSAVDAYIYDNPDVFYIDTGKLYFNIETTTRGNQKTYNCYINCGEEVNYFSNGYNSKEEVERDLKRIESVRDRILTHKTGDAYKDIKLIHDYLVYNLEYDTTVAKNHIYDIYGALVNHECVCEGYAKALKYMMDSLGMETIIVTGKGTNTEGKQERHAWNYINVDGKWYGVDATWDDPIIIGGYRDKEIQYTYFLKGSDVFNNDHFPSGFFTEKSAEFKYPQLSATDYKK